MSAEFVLGFVVGVLISMAIHGIFQGIAEIAALRSAEKCPNYWGDRSKHRCQLNRDHLGKHKFRGVKP